MLIHNHHQEQYSWLVIVDNKKKTKIALYFLFVFNETYITISNTHTGSKTQKYKCFSKTN